MKDLSDGEPSELLTAAHDFLNYLQVEKGLSENTLSAYRRALIRYLDFLSESGIDIPEKISKDHLVAFAGRLQDQQAYNLSPRSVCQAFSAVRMFHRVMVMEGHADSDPTGVLASPRITMRLPRALKHEQVEKLLETPSGDDEKGTRDRLILEMLYGTGMRISEFVGLDLGDLEMSERLVTCRGTGGRWRILPFGMAAYEVLEAYLKDARPELAHGSGTPALILNMRGGRLTRQGCWKIIKGHARSAGMEELVTPHVLRHTFATHLLEGGASLLVVQELLGHVSVSTTQIYTEVTRDHLMEVYRRTHPRA
ncbi:MAG: tyrosine recombinase XerD [Actinobacteria bacterium]|nr:tyrosine recombinase XerD [Actinomycetota bacterium]